jgi:hypothetical protein
MSDLESEENSSDKGRKEGEVGCNGLMNEWHSFRDDFR